MNCDGKRCAIEVSVTVGRVRYRIDTSFDEPKLDKPLAQSLTWRQALAIFNGLRFVE